MGMRHPLWRSRTPHAHYLWWGSTHWSPLLKCNGLRILDLLLPLRLDSLGSTHHSHGRSLRSSRSSLNHHRTLLLLLSWESCTHREWSLWPWLTPLHHWSRLHNSPNGHCLLLLLTWYHWSTSLNGHLRLLNRMGRH